MSKNIFIITVLVIFIGIAIWFFMKKTNNSMSPKNLESLSSSNNVSPSPINSSAAPVKENWVTLPNGLKILDVIIGPGREAKSGNVVAANYIGTLQNGKKFDSSYDRSEPFAFILGSGQVIKGWDIGIEGMKVGGKRKLIIPPELAYGSREISNGLIPANSTLYFEVELMAVEDIKPQ